MEKQLDDLKGEIDALTKKIDAAEEELKKETNSERAAVFLKSIERSNDDKKALLAYRHELSLALAAADPPGKNARLPRR